MRGLETVPGRWIGHKSCKLWPPGSTGRKPTNYFPKGLCQRSCLWLIPTNQVCAELKGAL